MVLYRELSVFNEVKAMHEVGLVQGIVDILRVSVQERRISRVTRVKLTVGKMTAAKPEALNFAFEVLSRDEPWLTGAALEVEEKELAAVCAACGEKQTLPDYRFICRGCGGRELNIVEGRELLVDFYEGE